MHILEEWRLRDIETKADMAIGKLWEIDALRSDVASLEHSMWEISATLASIQYELQKLQENKINEDFTN